MVAFNPEGARRAPCSHLVSFDLVIDVRHRNHIGDADAEKMKALTTLKKLSLTYTPVTNEGLKHIATLKGLEDLDLYGSTNITDAGLKHLESLTALRTILLHQCPKLTKEGVAKLKAALPGCDVIYSAD